ncbi:MAG: HNH endonuclease [Fibromonadales bacterium]|nr:HNH endonuclease [Fibromonadales bacterium]
MEKTGKKKRNYIPQRIRAKLQQEIGSKCPFCECRDVEIFEVHHIDGNPGNGDISNLIMLCKNCHGKANNKEISHEEVRRKKDSLPCQTKNDREKPAVERKISKITNVTGTNNVVGNNNYIENKTTINRPVKKIYEFPPGCLGNDVEKMAVVEGLIEKYNHFAKNGKPNFNYGVFRRKLKERYELGQSQKLGHLRIDRYDDIVRYIEERIDKTIIGRINKSRGRKNYSPAEEKLDRLRRDREQRSKIIPFPGN